MYKISKWLLTSGIQTKDGGFYCWYDTNTKSYPYIYSEITGYGITAMLYLGEIKQAVLAGEWLLKHRQKNGCLSSIYNADIKLDNRHCFKDNAIHAFDNGVIIIGLVNLFNAIGDERYYKAALKIADFLIDTMQKKDGSFHAIFDTYRNAIVDSPNRWSTQSGAYHSKIAIGLLKLYKFNRKKKYLESAKKICDYALKFQQDDGRFITYQEKDKTHLHPHCYAAEGLLYIGLQLKNCTYLLAASDATNWLFKHILPTGGLPCLYENGEFLPYERTDIITQTIRLGIFFMPFRKLAPLYERLYSFQHNSGGILFGQDLDGKKLMHINSWCSMFALQNTLDKVEEIV